MPQIRPDRMMDGPKSEPKPVFVDRSGHRRRVTVLVGVSIGTGLLVSLALIIAGLFAGSTTPLPGWPDSGGQHQGDDPTVDTPDTSSTGTPDQPTSTSATQPTSAAEASASTTGPQPTVSDRPGQGESHRSAPTTKPTKPPGKPE